MTNNRKETIESCLKCLLLETFAYSVILLSIFSSNAILEERSWDMICLLRLTLDRT